MAARFSSAKLITLTLVGTLCYGNDKHVQLYISGIVHLWFIIAAMTYSQVLKYLDIDTSFIIVALCTTTMDFE